MSGITHATITRMGANLNCSAAPAKRSYSPFPIVQLFGYGENSKMTQDNKESTAPCSGMNQLFDHRTLSERLAPYLISFGLVKGCTLTFGLRLLKAGIQAGAIYAPDGSVVAVPKTDCISWSESPKPCP